MGGVMMRKVIGALVLLSVAVVLRSGDITFGPVSRTSPALPASTTRVAGRFCPTAADSIASGKAAVRRATKKQRDIPAEFIKNPLFFLSTAPTDSLVLLPGIGPVLAERILGVRTGKRSFTRWDDLLVVKGIGPKTLDRLKRLK
jgi:predicted flap endonuclease-1-like 5' DNA nuclease